MMALFPQVLFGLTAVSQTTVHDEAMKESQDRNDL